MTTAAHPVFGTDTLRRGIGAATSADPVSLHADDAELRIVDRKTQPSHPKVLHGRDEIAAVLDDVCSRGMTHSPEACAVQGDHAACCGSCRHPDGVRVLSESMLTLRDGRITGQMTIQAWDE